MYRIKSYLKFVYSRQHSQYLYLIPHISHFLLPYLCLFLILWIPSGRLSRKLDNELAINLALSINYKCKFLSIFIYPFNFFCYWNWKGLAFFSIFSWKIKFSFKLFCKLFYNKIIIILWPTTEIYRNFFSYTIF